MAGHSRWAQVKHKKAGSDAKRGALFSKLSRLIAVAARDGGPNPEVNFKLRQAMEQARAAGMPKENIERAVSRASGNGEGADLRQVEYEAYGPGGSAFLIAGLTDNANRTTSEVKHILDEHGGRLAETGSVSWLFDRRLFFEFELAGQDAEKAELALIDAGAEDTSLAEDRLQVILPPERSEAFQKATAILGLKRFSSAFIAVPKSTVELEADARAKAEALAEVLENHPDINDVWTNVGS